MQMIQKPSTKVPLAPKAYSLLLDVLFKADAMGLLDKPLNVLALDSRTINHHMRLIAAKGIGQKALLDAELWGKLDPEEIAIRLDTVNKALEESPVPDSEMEAVRHYIPDGLLAKMLDISPVSLKRYSDGSRETPDEVGRRLHTLALVIGDLKGSFNDAGVRGWFNIKRPKALGNKSPVELLKGPWKPTDPEAIKVRNCSRSLNASIAT
jgi:hypothetical protein